jgi:hypothetical protein
VEGGLVAQGRSVDAAGVPLPCHGVGLVGQLNVFEPTPEQQVFVDFINAKGRGCRGPNC